MSYYGNYGPPALSRQQTYLCSRRPARLCRGGDVLLTFAIAGLLLVPCRRLKTSTLVALSLFFLAQPLEWAYAVAQWVNPGWAPPSLSVAESYASLKTAVDTGNF